jgi:hypothetical protein
MVSLWVDAAAGLTAPCTTLAWPVPSVLAKSSYRQPREHLGTCTATSRVPGRIWEPRCPAMDLMFFRRPLRRTKRGLPGWLPHQRGGGGASAGVRIVEGRQIGPLPGRVLALLGAIGRRARP